jgi:hypothetical protein
MFYKGQLVNAAEGALPASQFQAWLYQTLTAVRQYEKQLSAESEDAIAAATQNLSSLDGQNPTQLAEDGIDGQGQPADPGIITDTHSSAPPQSPPPVRRGKQTSSGLYIP